MTKALTDVLSVLTKGDVIKALTDVLSDIAIESIVKIFILVECDNLIVSLSIVLGESICNYIKGIYVCTTNGLLML